MASKSTFYCQNCLRHIQYSSKEEVIYHKETCGLKQSEVLKEADSGSINIASFTFGGRHAEGLKEMVLESASFNQSLKGGRKMSEEGLSDDKYGVGITNKIGQHNSFMSSVLQLIWNMKILRNFILNEITIIESQKGSFLSSLRVSNNITNYIVLL